MALHVIILAAGQGKRMFSKHPKVLHELAGKPILHHLLNTVTQINNTTIHVIHGHQGQHVQNVFKAFDVHWIEQKERLGTGHAVLQAMPAIPDNNEVLILAGDTPLVSLNTINELQRNYSPKGLSLVTVKLAKPNGYGRIIRDQKDKVIAIVEEKDATEEQKQIKEINTNIMLAPAYLLKEWLSKVHNDNAQQEYYLTDIIAIAAMEDCDINTSEPEDTFEILGVNNCKQLADIERHYQRQLAEKYMMAGLTLRDPTRFDCRGEIQFGHDVVVDVNVIFEGDVRLGNNCHIGANSILKNVTLGDNVVVLPNCIIEEANIADECQVGPFTRIRPKTTVAKAAKLGNFVEIKKSSIGEGTKISHLS